MEVLNAEYPCGDTLGSIAPDVNDFIIIIIIVVVINICLMLIFSSIEDRSLSDCYAFVCFVLF